MNRLVALLPDGTVGLRHASARALAALAGGIALGCVLRVPWWAPALVGAVAVAVAPRTRWFTLYLALLAAGMFYAWARAPIQPDSRLYESATFAGTVVEEPTAFDSNRAVIDLAKPWRGKVTLWLQDSLSAPRYGDVVQVAGHVRALDYPRNPGLVDRNVLAVRRGLVGSAGVRPGQMTLIARGRGLPAARLVVLPLRRYIDATIVRFLPPAEGALLRGLLIGGSRGLPRPVQDAFRDAGIVHILAVSGMNVSIVVAMVWLLLGIATIRGWWRFVLSLLVVALYLSLSGWTAAPARAGLMACAVLLSYPTQRRVTALASLCAAAIVLLLIDPWTLFDVGAQLSFAATAGIVLVNDQLRLFTPEFSRLRWLRRNVLGPLIVSIAATVATAPLLLHHFYRVQPLAFLSTAVVAPLVGFAMPLGIIVLAVNLVSSAVAGIFAHTLWFVLFLLLRLTAALGRLDWAIWEPGALAWVWVFWLYGMALLALGWRHRRARFGVAALLVAGVNIAVWTQAARRPTAQAVFLDVDQGDALVLDDTLGRHVVFDAGLDGAGVLRDYLRSRGIHYIDAVVVTHPDRDHYGGLLELDSRVSIGRLLVSTRVSQDTAYERLLGELAGCGTEIVRVGAGSAIEGFGFGVQFLAPDPMTVSMYESGALPTNPTSLVARVEQTGFTMLLTGDAEDLTAGVGHADLLKSPHHGSRKGNPDALYAAVAPAHVVVMGRYPTPAGLEQRFAGSGADYVNTRRDGAFIVRFGRNVPAFIRLPPSLCGLP